MRRLFQVSVLLTVAACASAPPPVAPTPVVIQSAPVWQRSEPPAALQRSAEPELPAAVTSQLPNGLRVVVVEHHRRPLVSVRLVLPSGTAEDPASKAGLTYVSVALLGDRYETADPRSNALESSLRRELIEAGGSFVFGAGADSAHVGIDGYAKDLPHYLDTLAGVVTDPRHGERSFKGMQAGLIEGLANLELNDEAVFREVVKRAAFGASSAYGRSELGTRTTLAELTLEDVIERQAALLRPSGATLVVVGDVQAKAVIASAFRSLVRWSGSSRAKSKPVMPKSSSQGPAALLVERRPALTSGVCLARPLADVAASSAQLELLAAIAGVERLNAALREERGVTYYAQAALLEHRAARAFIACTRVRASETSAGVSVSLDTLAELRRAGPTQTELDRARAELISRRLGSGDTVQGITAAWLNALSRGEDPNPKAEIAALREVTLPQLAAVADKVLNPASIRVVVWGDPKVTAPALATAGFDKFERVRLISLIGKEVEKPELTEAE